MLISCMLNLLHHVAVVHGWSCLVYPHWGTIRILGVIMLGISALGDHYLPDYLDSDWLIRTGVVTIGPAWLIRIGGPYYIWIALG